MFEDVEVGRRKALWPNEKAKDANEGAVWVCNREEFAQLPKDGKLAKAEPKAVGRRVVGACGLDKRKGTGRCTEEVEEDEDEDCCWIITFGRLLF